MAEWIETGAYLALLAILTFGVWFLSGFVFVAIKRWMRSHASQRPDKRYLEQLSNYPFHARVGKVRRRVDILSHADTLEALLRAAQKRRETTEEKNDD